MPIVEKQLDNQPKVDINDRKKLRYFSINQSSRLLKKVTYSIAKNKSSIFKKPKKIATPEKKSKLTKAIYQCEHLGSTPDNKSIFLYQYTKKSPILREIGRLREIAFRAVGEGSNRRRDIDHYDKNYYHLILWDKDDMEIVGAYRFGDAKKLLNAGKSIYTNELFDYKQSMNPYFAEGLELGRSFIQPRYWGKRSLDYLWLGLGAFLKKHPEYRYVFGPVTLSGTLPEEAKALLYYFYNSYFGSQQILANAKLSYRPPDNIQNPFTGLKYQEEFTQLKSILSSLGTTIPTLYKQYTELYETGGIHFLDFGIDKEFNDCIDGLVLADLHCMKTKKRQRYFDSIQ